MAEERINISTPEHVSLSFKIAGLGSRATAQIIDWFIITVVNFLITLGIMVAQDRFYGSIETGYAIAIVIIINFLFFWGYFSIFEFAIGGRTPGKILAGLRVIQADGRSITLLSAILRNLLRIIDFLPSLYLLGIVMIFFHPKHKRIGDLVAGTIVIYERKKGKKKGKLEKEIEKRGLSLNRLEISEWDKKKITARDWELLKTYMDRRKSLTKSRKQVLTYKVGGILLPKVGMELHKEHGEVENDLLILYLILREDWEYEIK